MTSFRGSITASYSSLSDISPLFLPPISPLQASSSGKLSICSLIYRKYKNKNLPPSPSPRDAFFVQEMLFHLYHMRYSNVGNGAKDISAPAAQSCRIWRAVHILNKWQTRAVWTYSPVKPLSNIVFSFFFLPFFIQSLRCQTVLYSITKHLWFSYRSLGCQFRLRQWGSSLPGLHCKK